MEVSVLKVVLLLGLLGETHQKNVRTDAYIAKSVADWFGVSCIVIFHSNEMASEDVHEAFQGFKIMFEDLKMVSARKFQLETVLFRYNSDRCTQMLYVVDGRRKGSRPWLEKMSHSVNLGGPIWLIFLPETDTAEGYLQNTYTTFDSNFITVEGGDPPILQQVYRVSMKHHVRVTPFGNWTPECGLTVHGGYVPYWHRNDLEGKTFTVSAIENWPLVTITRDNKVGGYFGRVWKELEERLNFSTVYVKPTDIAIGVQNNGKWNGLIGMIARGEIDAGISEITMTPERIPEVDFLRPLYSTRYQLFFKSPGMVIQWDLIYRPFQTEVWLTLLAWLGLLTLLLKLGHRIGLRYGLEDLRYRREYDGYHCFFFVASAFSQQANAILPKSGFCRLVLATAYIFSMVVLIIYSCILMSMTAVHKFSRPFNSLESFLRDGTYRLYQIPGSDAYSYFSLQNSTDPILQKIYQTQFLKLPEKDFPTSHRTALDHVCKSEKVAHLGEFGTTVLSAEELQQRKGCQFDFLDRPLKLLYLAMAVTKDSPYRDAFDYQINQMVVTGILNRFRNMNFPLRLMKIDVTFQPVSIEQTAQMNLLFIAGFVMAIFLFIGEVIVKRYRQL